MRYLLLLPIVLIAGYVIARNHHRLRNLGMGTLVGSSLPPLPDPSEHDGHGHDRHDHSHDQIQHDHASGAGFTHTDTTDHSY
jgi:hypothetical protein